MGQLPRNRCFRVIPPNRAGCPPGSATRHERPAVRMPGAADCLMPKIRAALLIQYAEDDPRINAMREEYLAALKANGVTRGAHLSRHPPRFPQQLHPALQRRGGEARLIAPRSLLPNASWLTASACCPRRDSDPMQHARAMDRPVTRMTSVGPEPGSSHPCLGASQISCRSPG